MIKFLSSRGLASRGNSDLVGSTQNNNFFGILELLVEYDTFLAKHIQESEQRQETCFVFRINYMRRIH